MTEFDGWADVYDWIFGQRGQDLNFYMDQAQQSVGQVLELGCGTGRVAIPLIRSGIQVVGVDNSAKMLAIARGKSSTIASDMPSPQWVIGDMRDVSLGTKFPLILMPYRGFLSLLSVEDQMKCLDNIKTHLEPGGKFIFDIFVPDLHTITEDSSTPVHLWDIPDPYTGKTLIVWDQSTFDNHHQVMNIRLILEEVDPEGIVLRKSYRQSQIRYMYRYETQHLLQLAGFEILNLYGGFEYQDFDVDATDMVWVVRYNG